MMSPLFQLPLREGGCLSAAFKRLFGQRSWCLAALPVESQVLFYELQFSRADSDAVLISVAVTAANVIRSSFMCVICFFKGLFILN